MGRESLSWVEARNRYFLRWSTAAVAYRLLLKRLCSV